jgi:hypothetical protein
MPEIKRLPSDYVKLPDNALLRWRLAIIEHTAKTLAPAQVDEQWLEVDKIDAELDLRSEGKGGGN